jgi:DNA-binding transcriptional MocR family regulator
MSLRRREALVRLARRYDALVVTDDVYDFLQWSAERGAPAPDRACVPRIVDVDRVLDGGPVDDWGHAISNGSFSKLIGPGTRTGWAEASEKLAYGLSQAYVRFTLDDPCTNPILQWLVPIGRCAFTPLRRNHRPALPDRNHGPYPTCPAALLR